jgi:hypothetical protein
MPSRERVQELISFAEQGKLVEVLQEFYAEDATQQENGNAPRVGTAALLEFERNFAASVAEIHMFKADAVVIDGERVAINWIFDCTSTNGHRNQMNEIAYQVWRGDKIQPERFYYDPTSLHF